MPSQHPVFPVVPRGHAFLVAPTLLQEIGSFAHGSCSYSDYYLLIGLFQSKVIQVHIVSR